MCVTLSLSVFSAGENEEYLSEYLTVSTVCVHPLLCVIVKKQCHLLWDREGFLNVNHMVDLFTEAKYFLQLQKNTRQIIVPLDLSL